MEIQGLASANLSTPVTGRHYALLFTPSTERLTQLLALASPLANTARVVVIDDAATLTWDGTPAAADDLLGQGVNSTVVVGKLLPANLPVGPRSFLENPGLSGGFAPPIVVPANRRVVVFVDIGEATNFAIRWSEDA